MGSRKKCNFCKHATITPKTRYNHELLCRKRRKKIFVDNKCDFFEDMKELDERRK